MLALSFSGFDPARTSAPGPDPRKTVVRFDSRQLCLAYKHETGDAHPGRCGHSGSLRQPRDL